MKKNLTLFLLLIFTIQFLTAQNDWKSGEIYLKSGDVKKGLVQIPIATTMIDFSSPKVEFRKAKKGKKEKYEEEEIQKMVLFDDKGNSRVYKYIPTKRNKKELFFVFHKTENYTLYGRKIAVGNASSFGAGGVGGPMLWFSSEADEYWIKGKKDKTAFRLLKSGRMMRYFKKQAKEYFGDCPALFSALENKELETTDIPKLLQSANFCE